MGGIEIRHLLDETKQGRGSSHHIWSL